jgi:phospholipid/cholesterol/gamma-HCH transport system substrate-binding protein
MTIRNDVELPANSAADIRQTSLLGEKYIELAAPDGVAPVGRLAPGALVKQTNRNPEVEEVLGALSSVLSGGNVGQLKTISAELNKAMNGRQGDLRSVLSQLDVLVGSLDHQKANIVDALDSVNKLTSTLNKERAVIGSALDSFGPALKVLNEQHQDLMKMLTALDKLGTVGTRVIQQSKDNLVADLRELGPTLKALADAGGSLPKGVVMMASFPFPKNAGSLAKGDYSNALFHMDFDLNKALNAALHGGNAGLPNIAQLCAIYGGSGNCAQLMGALCSVTKITQFCAPLPTILPSGGSLGGGGNAQPNPLAPVTGILGPATSGILPPSLTGPGSPLGGLLGPTGPLGGLL